MADSTVRAARCVAIGAAFLVAACAGDDSAGGDAGAADGSAAESGSEPAVVFPGGA